MIYPILTAQEAAEFIQNGYNVGVSGFTASGCPKVVPVAIAERAQREHEAGRAFKNQSVQVVLAPTIALMVLSRVPMHSTSEPPISLTPICVKLSTPTLFTIAIDT